MLQHVFSARRSVRALAAALASGSLVSCSSSDGITPPGQTAGPAAVTIVSRDPHPGVAEQRLPDQVVVRVVDAEGKGVPSAVVSFAVTGGGGSIIPEMTAADGEGYASAVWTLGSAGEQAATVRVGGVSAQLRAAIVPAPDAVRPMMGMLVDYIASSIANLEDAVGRNPQLASYYNAKLAVLRRRGLGGEIVEGGRYAEGSVASRSGRSIPVTALFTLEPMREEAVRTIRYAERGVPVVEEFLGTPFPTATIRVWHGFIMGNTGGGGTLNMEDRATYEARTPTTRLPYDAIVIHELSHSYVGNESLTQFLELYAHNVLQTGSADVAAWTHRRDWEPGREANDGVHALLDVYQLIGPAAMASAYRAVLPLRPPYGQPLSAAAQQAFVDAAPAAAKATVAAKMAKIVF